MIEYYSMPDRRYCTVRVIVNSVEITRQYFKTIEKRKAYIKFMSLILRHAGLVCFDLSFHYQTRKRVISEGGKDYPETNTRKQFTVKSRAKGLTQLLH